MPENKPDKTPLTPEVIELLKTVLAETRKPTELEQFQIEEHKARLEARKNEIEAAQSARLQGASDRQRIRQSQIAEQKRCQHEGGKPSPHSYAVFVNDHLGGFILCQRCQAVVRMEQAKTYYGGDKYTGTIIFDDNLFNKLFQASTESGIFA
jgi:hypothetical protein